MIILADVPFFDAFSYAGSLSKNKDLKYWSPGEEVPSCENDIFSESEQSDVCLVSKAGSQKDFEIIGKLLKSFKAIVVWDSDFESAKKHFSLSKLEYKFVEIPKYISLRESILKCDSIKKEVAKEISLELDGIPISTKLSRDCVSSIMHKISVIYTDGEAKCPLADIAFGSPVSMLDITAAFCNGEDSFFNFCHYYFGKSKEIDPSLKSWTLLFNKFLVSGGDSSHEIYRHGGTFSPKIIEAINGKLSICIKSGDILYCLMCWSIIMNLNVLDDFLLSTSLMRSSISGKLNKKQSINIIRNLNE